MLVSKLCGTTAQRPNRKSHSILMGSVRFLLNRLAIASVISGSSLCYSQSLPIPDPAGSVQPSATSTAPGLKPLPQLDVDFLKEPPSPTTTGTQLNYWRPATPNPAPAVGNLLPDNSPQVDFHQPTNGQNVPGFVGIPSDTNGRSNSAADTTPQLGNASSSPEPWATEIVAEGQQFAAEGRWSEALTHYQTALRKHPDSRLILEHRQRARIQVDLRQRLSDAKYVHYALTDSPDYAVTSYNEVLSKIQAFHVDQPDWNAMAQHGLNALLTAFENSEFQQKLGGEGFARTQRATSELLRVNLSDYRVHSRAELLNLVGEVARLVQDKTGMPQSVVIHEFASSAISALDTYSSYLSPGHFDDVNSQIRGNFVGIGIELRAKEDCLEIVKVIPGGPADQARIRAGDRLLAVNGQQVIDIGGDPAADLLKGQEGSELTVTVETPEAKQYRLRIVRRQIEIPSIEQAEIVDADQGIGYIKLANFQKNTLAEFDYAMQMLKNRGMKALVLDLRENPGGVLDVSVTIANRFLTSGVIVQTRGRNPMENAVHPASAQNTWSLPLVVLVNEHSASASEILAAAIKDHRRGVVVGNRSFGKGSVQGIWSLSSGRGGIRLTTAKFYSPTGREIHLQGVTPDFTVQQVAKPSTDNQSSAAERNEEDLAMVAALKISRNQLTPTASATAGSAR